MESAEKKTGWTPGLVLEHISAMMSAADKRYEERFAAQEKAVKDALAAQEKAVNAALAASEKAVLVAENNAQKWRENANEWRSAMTDREQNFTSRGEFGLLKERLDTHHGNSDGMKALWGWIVGAVGVAAAIVAMATHYVKT